MLERRTVKILLSKKTLAAFCAIIVSVIIISAITNYNVENLIESQNRITQKGDVIERLNLIESAILDMTSSARGYIITGDDAFVLSYNEASALLDKRLEELSEMTRGSQSQMANIEVLKEFIKQRRGGIEEMIEIRKGGGVAEAENIVLGERGEITIKQIKQQILTMIDTENSLLQARISESESQNQNIIVILIVNSAVIIGIATILLVLFNRDTSVKIEAQRRIMLGEQKTAEMTQFDKLKDEFAAMITHELKTPIVPITGYCKMLKTRMLGELNKEQMEAVEVIDQSTEQLVTLISDILDARKLDLNKMKFNIEEMSIGEFFDGLNSSYRQVLMEKGKEFVVDVPAERLVIKMDKTRLRQIFDNLISNAINYTLNENPKITVGCRKDDNGTILYVKDNGIGIPVDAQRDLFKKFYQADTSERRKIGGTGLGLAISKGILDKLNAHIWVESDGKTGTAFYIKLNG